MRDLSFTIALNDWAAEKERQRDVEVIKRVLQDLEENKKTPAVQLLKNKLATTT